MTIIKGSAITDKARIEALARGARAVKKLREHARETGFSKLSEKKIEDEIKKARAKRLLESQGC